MSTPLTCPVCRQDALVRLDSLRLAAPGLELEDLSGEQCTSCGHLGIQIPSPWLLRLFPVGVGQITMGRRERLRARRHRRPSGS